MSDATNGSRITIVETVYYQRADRQPTSVCTRFSTRSDSEEQHFTRELRVGQEWQTIDFGWVKSVGMLVIVNEREKFQVRPTPERQAEADSRLVEIDNGGTWLIPPGGSHRGIPVGELRIRCRTGEARVTVTVFPG